MYICEVSMLVYGDSKYFENNTLESLCALLQKYNTVPIFGQTFSDGEYIFSDEILKKYYVYKLYIYKLWINQIYFYFL